MIEINEQKYYANKVWQIQRFHSSDVKITTNLSPDFGVPTWTIEVKIKGEVKFIDSGVNLWKRLKKAAEFLEKHYGENCYKYAAEPIKEEPKVLKAYKPITLCKCRFCIIKRTLKFN